MFKTERSLMTQVNSRFDHYPHSTFKTTSKGLPRVLIPCYSKGADVQTALNQQEHSKAAYVLLHRKKHDVHLLSKLSPYFRNCVSHELLKGNWSTNEKLPSLCYSCNKTLDGRHEKTISFNRIKLNRRAFPPIKDSEDNKEDMHEQLTTSSPWKNNYRDHHQTGSSCTPFQRFEKAQSFMEFSKHCFTRSPPLILPEVIKITPQKKTTARQKDNRVNDVALVPPPTPTVRYIRDLSPELRTSLFVITLASTP